MSTRTVERTHRTSKIKAQRFNGILANETRITLCFILPLECSSSSPLGCSLSCRYPACVYRAQKGNALYLCSIFTEDLPAILFGFCVKSVPNIFFHYFPFDFGLCFLRRLFGCPAFVPPRTLRSLPILHLRFLAPFSSPMLSVGRGFLLLLGGALHRRGALSFKVPNIDGVLVASHVERRIAPIHSCFYHIQQSRL